MTARRVHLQVSSDGEGVRLDTFLAQQVPDLTRSAWKRHIEESLVRVDGVATAKPGLALKAGMAVDTTIPQPQATSLEGEAIAIEVVHEDDDIAVIVKPAGIVTHPGHGALTGTLVHALLGRGMPLAPAGGTQRPGIVHRLDKDTSGLMVIAKTDAAHRALASMFAKREVSKTYRALVWGRPQPTSGTIDEAIGRSRNDPTKMTVHAPRGRAATTIYRTVEPLNGFALLDIDLVTGRTHQIRVHFAAKHHPVIGDTRYGGAPWKRLRDPRRRAVVSAFARLGLHAAKLAFAHPITGTPLAFAAPIPADFAELVSELRKDV
jgi:23S rRNA pseudouridine1911/1915/1917 synthase